MPGPNDDLDLKLEETPEPKTPAGPSGDDQQLWERRYKGLQKTFDALQRKYDKLSMDFDKLVEDSEGTRQQSQAHETEKGTLSKQVEGLNQQLVDLTTQLESSKLGSERMKLILSEFPQLAQFEADGLLPSAATLDDLKPKLEAFNKRLGIASKGNAMELLEGHVPDGGDNDNKQSVRDIDTVWREITSLSVSGMNTPEARDKYDKLMVEWLELNKTKK